MLAWGREVGNERKQFLLFVLALLAGNHLEPALHGHNLRTIQFEASHLEMY